MIDDYIFGGLHYCFNIVHYTASMCTSVPNSKNLTPVGYFSIT